ANIRGELARRQQREMRSTTSQARNPPTTPNAHGSCDSTTRAYQACRAGLAGRGTPIARTSAVTKYASDPDPRRSLGSAFVIGHRGASGTRPENTLAAFRRAEALGAHMIELDVQLTRDREVVVVHDWTLGRCSNGRGRVSARTLAEL